jgi:4-amino-4-deoxy-L-arabinose transferase-like glycosyltransferase
MTSWTSIAARRRLEWLSLAVILILAAVLRLGAPGITEFKRDEANLSHLALDTARGRVFPLLGIDSSVGVRNAPFSVYVIVPPYLFTSDPTLATLYVGLLNVSAVGLVYLLARRYYGRLAAFVGGLLYAASPWAVIFSRKIWAQDFLPVFVVMTIGTGLLGFVEGKRWAQLFHLPLLVITGQIHYGAFVLIPLTLYLIAIGRHRLTRAFVFSIVLALALAVPYAVGLAQSGLLRPETVQRILTAGQDKPHAITLSGEAIHDTALTIAGTEIHSLVGPQAYPAYLASVPDAYPVFNVLPWLVLLAALWLIVRSVRRRDQRTPIDVLLLIWLLFTPLAFSITWTPMYVHYLIPMLPAAYLVLGVATHDLWRALKAWRWRRQVFFALGAAMGMVVILQVWLFVGLLSFVAAHDTADGFGITLQHLLSLREVILSLRPQNVLVNLDGQYLGYHDEATVWNFLLYDVPSVRFLDDKTDAYPAEPATYLSHECTGQSRNFRFPSSGRCYALTTRAPGDFDPNAYQPVANADQARFANGLRLLRYRWTAVPQPCLALVWTTDGPASEDYSFAIHFVDADKQVIAYGDGLSWRGMYWRQGDTVVRRFCATSGQDRKADIVAVDVGMYTTPDNVHFNNVDLLDVQGKPSGQSITLPLK